MVVKLTHSLLISISNIDEYLTFSFLFKYTYVLLIFYLSVFLKMYQLSPSLHFFGWHILNQVKKLKIKIIMIIFSSNQKEKKRIKGYLSN